MKMTAVFEKELVNIDGKVFVPYLSNNVIRKRIRELASEIERDYKGKNPVFLVVLKGAIFFASELMQNISQPIFVEILKAESYGNRLESSGKVNLFLTNRNFGGKDIVVVEDIIDTGLTIKTIMDELARFEPSSVELAVLLLKKEKLKFDLSIKYCGFEIPDKFVIGFGLDFAEYGRNLKDIYILKE
jgi:hypoxanthine phosphoribosyltransferase